MGKYLAIIAALINLYINSGESKSYPSSPSKAAHERRLSLPTPSSPSRAIYELRVDQNEIVLKNFYDAKKYLTKLKAIYARPLPSDQHLVALPRQERNDNVSIDLCGLSMCIENIKKGCQILELKTEPQEALIELESLKCRIEEHAEILKKRGALIILADLINSENEQKFAKIVELIKVQKPQPDLEELGWLIGKNYQKPDLTTAKIAASNDIKVRKEEYLEFIPLVQKLEDQTDTSIKCVNDGKDIVCLYDLTLCYLTNPSARFCC